MEIPVQYLQTARASTLYGDGRPGKQSCENPDYGDAAGQRNVNVLDTPDPAVSPRTFR